MVSLSAQHQQWAALTGIRGIAAFMVFFHHLPLLLEPKQLIGLQLSFYTGVTLFFVLSGFLITYRYFGRIELSLSGAWNYFVNRFARIFPVYFLVLTIVILIQKNFEPVYLLQNYTLTHNLSFLFPSRGLAVTPSWSLTVEACFYALAPLLFVLSRKLGLWFPLLFCLGILCLLLSQQIKTGTGPMNLIYASFFGNSIAFFTGIWLAIWLRKNKKAALVKRRHYTLAGSVGLLLASLPLAYVTNKDSTLQQPVMVVFNHLLLPVPAGLLYYGLMHENTWLQRLLSTRLMQQVGRSSYAFYLIHLPLIQFFALPYLKPLFSNSHNSYVLVVFFLTTLSAIFVFRYFEEPMNRLIRRLQRQKPKPAPFPLTTSNKV